MRLVKEDDTVDGVKVVPIYQILSNGSLQDLGEKPVRIQARSTNTSIYQDDRDVDLQKRIGDVHSWLGSNVIDLTQQPATNGSWVPYVRNLIGLTDITPTDPDAEATPLEVPLSSLITLSTKCSHMTTETFPWVEDGCWFLPDIEGNKGKDEHNSTMLQMR